MEEKDLKILHRMSFNHRTKVEASTQCGCFYCKALFSPDQIEEWTDKGQTAMCPECGIDSVLPDQPPMAVLEAMRQYWF